MDTLLLNSTGKPVSVLPLSTLTWHDAIKYLVLEKAAVIEWHKDWIVHSQNWSTHVPSIMMLNTYMKPKTSIRYSKATVFLRDLYTCQYCGNDLDAKECTIDHVIPVSRGGKTCWSNVVTACTYCNVAKGHKTHIKPFIKPYKPDFYELINKKKMFHMNLKHTSWKQYIIS